MEPLLLSAFLEQAANVDEKEGHKGSLFAMVIGFTGYQFWRIRAISEQTNTYLKQYCDKHGLQLLSVARAKTQL